MSTSLSEDNRVPGIDSHLIHTLRNFVLSFADLPVFGQLGIDLMATRNTGKSACPREDTASGYDFRYRSSHNHGQVDNVSPTISPDRAAEMEDR